MKRRITASVLIAVLAVNAALPVYSAKLTDPAELSKALTYGLNTATYSTEKKDMGEGAKKLVAYDLIWDLLGENEKILSGNTEAVIPQLKDRALQIQAVIVGIDELSTKLGEGNYDEALFTTVNTGVSLINHPLINLLWESIKLAYESHKLVKSTKAELQIEELYNVVNNDRRLIGSTDGQSPKLISLNSDTVTYFYNKYLITDASTREKVKAYVKVRLGQEFPEMPTGSWLYAKLTMTAETEEEEYELRKLQEFENVSRGWILKLLEDLNNQVKEQWAATRARQFNAELAKFKAQFEGFNSELSNIEASFINMKKEQKNFPQYIQNSKANLESMKKIINAEKKPSLEQAYDLNKQAVRWYYQNNQYRSFAMSLGDIGSSNAFETEIASWNNLINTIALLIKELEQVSKNEKEQETIEANKNSQNSSISAAYYQKNYAGLITEPELTDIEPVKIEYITLLTKVLDECDVIYSDTTGEDAVKQCFAKCSDAPQDKIWQCQEPCRKMQAELDSKKQQKVDEAFKEAAEFIKLYQEQEKQKLDDIWQKVTIAINAQGEADHQALKAFWKDFMKSGKTHVPGNQHPEVLEAYAKYSVPSSYASGVISRMNSASQEKIKNDIKQLEDIYSAFIALSNNLKEKKVPEYENFTAQASSFYAPLGLNSDKIDQAYQFAVGSEQYLSENRYTYLGKFSSGEIYNIDSILMSKAEEILGASKILADTSVQIQSSFPILIKEWEKITTRYNNWKNENHLNPNSDSLSSVLAPYFEDERKEELAKLEKAYNQSSMKMTKIRSVLKTLPQSASTEINNREQDAQYLYELAAEWKKWYKAQEVKGIITKNNNGEVNLSIRKCEKTGMAILYEPYAHYAEENELKNNTMAKSAKADLQSLRVYNFISSNMPALKQKLDNMFTLASYIPAKEPNIIFAGYVIYESDLDKVEQLIKSLNIERDDSYISTLKDVQKLLPLTISFPELNEKNKNDYASKLQNKYGVFNDKLTTYDLVNIETGKRYADLREKLREKMILKGQLIEREQANAFAKEEALKRLAEYKKEYDIIARTLAALTKENEIHDLYQKYWDLRTKYFNDKLAEDTNFTNNLIALDNEFTAKSKTREENQQTELTKIKEFYNEFKQAYESQNDSLVMSKISNNWECAEGTTTSDLENNFQNMFSVFNAINYNISNMNIAKNTDNTYRVSYDVEIIGQIYDSGITHKEKSSVSEIVGQEGKSFKIQKTLNGRFWYVE